MSLSISSHLNDKEIQNNKQTITFDSLKPRTELQFNPEEALSNADIQHLSVRHSVHQEIISDIDSIDEIAADLDSSHEKKLLAKMEQNRKDILEEEISYYENSDIYSDISRNQHTASLGVKTKDSDLSSDLSSLVEISPSESKENINAPSIIKLNPIATKRVSVSSPAPILLPQETVSVADSTAGYSNGINQKQNFQQTEAVKIDNIPEAFFSEKVPFIVNADTNPGKQSSPFSPIANSKLQENSYYEDSFDDISEISLPGLETAQKAETPIQKSNNLEAAKTPASALSQVQEPSFLEMKIQSRAVNIDGDAPNPTISNANPKIINEVEKKRYEKEISELKLRIHKIERDNNDMVTHASEKLKQYEYLESLAKNEMLNFPNKMSSILPHQSGSANSGSIPSLVDSNNNNSSIYKMYDDLKKESESKIENLNIKLKEEMSKTARFTVLKIQNEDQQKEIHFLEDEIKELKGQILNVTDQLFMAQKNSSALLLEERQPSSLESKNNLGQEQTKSKAHLLANRLQVSRSDISDRNQELEQLKSELENATAQLSKVTDEKFRIEKDYQSYQKNLHDVTSRLAVSNLTFEQKDAIMVALQKMDRNGDVINENLRTILENIHQLNLQGYEKNQNYLREIEMLKIRVAEVEQESSSKLEKSKDEIQQSTKKIDFLESQIQELTLKNNNLTSELLSKEASLKRTHSLWESCQTDLESKQEILKSLQDKNNMLSKRDTQNDEAKNELDRAIERLQQEQQISELQSTKWKKELEIQMTTTQALQKSLEESTNSLRELSSRATKCDELEKANLDMKKYVEALQIQLETPSKDHVLLKNENESLKFELTDSLNKRNELMVLIESEKKNSAALVEKLNESQTKSSKNQNQIDQLSRNILNTEKELNEAKELNLKMKIEYDELLQKTNLLVADHKKAIALKDTEYESIKIESSAMSDQVKKLQESLKESKKINLELTESINQQKASTQSMENLRHQELIDQNQRNENRLNAKLSEEKKNAEALRQTVSNYAENFEKVTADLEFLKNRNKTIEFELNLKQKELDHSKLMKNTLENEILHLKTEHNLSSNLQIELDELRNQLNLKDKEIRQLHYQNGKGPIGSGKINCFVSPSASEENEMKLLQNEKFKLDYTLKMTERELFNEKNRFQNENIKWQEIEHKCSAIERTNQLLENELKSVRLKYEHLFGEQTKMDLNTQDTVLKLQSKISEQRQTIQDLQVVNQENQLLQAEINNNHQKMSQLKIQNNLHPNLQNIGQTEKPFNIDSDIVIERLSNLETDILNIKKMIHENTVNQNQKVRDTPLSEVEAAKQKINQDFELGIKEVSDALKGVFHLRREVDHEREISQNIMQKTYEARLEELKKQIRRKC